MNSKNNISNEDLLARSRELAGKTSLSELTSGSELHSAITYHQAALGSEARSRLCIHAGIALGLPVDATVNLAAAVETLHNASLIQDDLQDNDAMRRGRAAVWKKFGQDIAINATDLLLSNAFALAASAGPIYAHKLVAIMNRAVARTLQGQTNDLHVGQQPGLDQAIAIAREKSGTLFSLSLELPLVMADYQESLSLARETGTLFGIGYQIFDDLQDREGDRLSGNTANMALMVEDNAVSKYQANTAEELAYYFLSEAASGAAELPSGCGDLLIEKCSALLQVLEREAA
ncbi:MAG: polyprenyl synthetase [Gammaproteobacteria bacterium]|nr:polyprenyl synthetase [Gammaproteobacteria bacterium]